MDEPHKRLIVCAPLVCGIWVSKDAIRAMFQPCSRVWLTQPQITSSTSAGLIFSLRFNKLLIKCADISSARVLRCMPPLERPIGVRPKSTITASLGFKLMFFTPASTCWLLTEKRLTDFSHLAQLVSRLVQRAQLGIAIG